MSDQPEFNIHNQELYDRIKRCNDSIAKICQDFWDYCSRNLFKQKSKPGESGSSIMGQKSNPWRSEGAEEISYQANDNFAGFARLIKYRMQGDLRRSIQMRSIGVPFAQTVIAIKRLTEEMKKYEPNLDEIKKEVDSHPEMLAAPIQIILRREGLHDAYDTVKAMTKAKRVTELDYRQFFDTLQRGGKISNEVAMELYGILEPEENLGNADKYATDALKQAKLTIKDLKQAYD
jgi:adenylosuccinate lyase